MSRLLRLSLILLLLVTGTALGHARGQSRLGTQVVLCSGGAVTTVTLDRDGRSAPVVQICPDMALSLLAGLSPEPSLAAPLRPARAVRWAGADRPVGRAAVVAALARGPPRRA